MPDFSPDFSKRDCSLPTGCSDLLDVLKLGENQLTIPTGPVVEPVLPFPIGKIDLGPLTTVDELAAKTAKRSFEVIATLLKWQIFAPNGDKVLTFEEAARVAEDYGFEVRKTDL